jgi:sphinganine-1-phosphate aldolase
MLPAVGLSKAEILATLNAYRQTDVPWRAGRLFAGLYDPGDDVRETIKAAYTEFLTENALYPNYYPSLLVIENDIISALKELLRGGPEACGNCTSGGTESIVLAVKAARDMARAERGITQPEIVICRTAHAAFHKACQYLSVTPVVTECVPETFRADPAAFAGAITPNTIMLVASAPSYAHGVVDPVTQIAALAQEHGLLCHVDACVGGVQLSVMRRMGHALPDFDLSVPGVTSLSVDMHKYGYAAKNASVVLYGSRALRRYALFACASTTGYAVINTGVLSTRSGGPLAGAWATLHALGEAGYQQIVREVQAATAELIAGINAIPGLRVLGAPDMCMLAFTADLNVFALDDAMTGRGWALQPQFSAPHSPANLHLSVNRSNVTHVSALLTDLRAAVDEIRAHDPVGGVELLRAEIVRLMANPGPQTFAQVAALAGLAPGEMPSGFARVNTVLDLLPDQLADALLVEYLNSIYA